MEARPEEIGLEDEGFDSTVLCCFRRKLLDRGLERALFERLVNAAREAGLITKDAAQLIDSSHVLGAAGARDTYALIRGGIRKLVRVLGYTASRRKAELEEPEWPVSLLLICTGTTRQTRMQFVLIYSVCSRRIAFASGRWSQDEKGRW